jgi:hypothetical protein
MVGARPRSVPGAALLIAAIAVLLLVCHLGAQAAGPDGATLLYLPDRLFDLALLVIFGWYGLALGRRLGAPLRGAIQSGDAATTTLVQQDADPALATIGAAVDRIASKENAAPPDSQVDAAGVMAAIRPQPEVVLMPAPLIKWPGGLATRSGRDARAPSNLIPVCESATPETVIWDEVWEALIALALGMGALALAILGIGLIHLLYAPVLLLGWAGLTFLLRYDLALISSSITRQIHTLAQTGSVLLARWAGQVRFRRERKGAGRGQRRTQGAAVEDPLPVRLLAAMQSGPPPWLLALGLLVAASVPLWLASSLPMGTGVGMEWDAPAYHLAGPKLWLTAHAITPLPDVQLINAPAAVEMFYVVGLAAGSESVGRAMSVAAAVLLWLALAVAARRLFGRQAAWIAPALLGAIPWLVPEIPATLNDLPSFVALVLAAGELALVFKPSPPMESRLGATDRGGRDARAPSSFKPASHGSAALPPPPMQWSDRMARAGETPALPVGRPSFLLGVVPWQTAPARGACARLIRAGLLAGIAASCKAIDLPGIVALGGAAAVLAAAARIRGQIIHPGSRRPGRSSFLAEKAVGPVYAAVLAGGLVIIPALAVLAPWLIKSLVFFGNPLYPVAVAAATTGSTSATGVPAASASSGMVAAMVAPLGSLAGAAWQALAGWPLLALAAPFLLPDRERRWRAMSLIVCLLVASLLWLRYVPLYVEPRYYVWLLALTVLLVAGACQGLLERLARLPGAGWNVLPAAAGRWLIALALAPGCFVFFALALNQAERSPAMDLALGRVAPARILATAIGPYTAERWIDHATPPRTVVAVVNTTLSYWIDRPHLGDWYGGRQQQLAAGGDARLAELRAWCAAGVRVVLLNRGDDLYPAGEQPVAIDTTWLETPGLAAHLLFSSHNADVYALQPCAAVVGMPR